VYSNNLSKAVQELLTIAGVKTYYIDQIPSFDISKNLNGLVAWDIEMVSPMHNSEGLEHRDGKLALFFELSVHVFGGSLQIRNEIETKVLDILQPVTSGRRVPLQYHTLTNAYVRYILWVNTTEYPVPKTGHSNAEVSASVLLFNSSFSV